MADMRMNKMRMIKLQECLQQQRRLIEQLRCEAQITPMRVSQVIEDIVKYCETHREEDVLIPSFNKPPETGRCTLL